MVEDWPCASVAEDSAPGLALAAQEALDLVLVEALQVAQREHLHPQGA